MLVVGGVRIHERARIWFLVTSCTCPGCCGNSYLASEASDHPFYSGARSCSSIGVGYPAYCPKGCTRHLLSCNDGHDGAPVGCPHFVKHTGTKLFPTLWWGWTQVPSRCGRGAECAVSIDVMDVRSVMGWSSLVKCAADHQVFAQITDLFVCA